MSKLITRIKRLALALCFVTPLVSWAATTAGYEDFGDTAGVQLWRTAATGSGVTDFAFAKFAPVAADGTVGETYTQGTSSAAIHWRRWASKYNNGDNSAYYTAPGLVLVYDQAGLMATPSSGATFAPVSFGGLWVKELGANDTPYGLTDAANKNRATEFGATGYATLFKFEKSFTINRGAASTFYGTATVNITGDAVFTASTGYATVVDAGATLKLTGDSTAAMSVGTGLTVNGTLDLTASTLPTISGNVTLSNGSSLVLPAGIATGEAISVPVCSGTLSSSGVISVKIGSADAINAELTVSGGAITQIDEVVVAKTFDSDYPSVVPAGYIYTFTASAATELAAVTVNGTLKTEGDFTITDLKVAAAGALEVVSGNTTVGGAATCQIKGNVTVDAGATLTNTLTDSLDYNGSMTVDVSGTLAMGSTRWSIPSGCTFNLRGGAQVTGTGDTLASLDIISASGQGLNVYAGTSSNSVTIEGPVRVRANETRIWVAGNTTLILSRGVVQNGGHTGSFRQTGPGTLQLDAAMTLTGTSIMTQGTLRLNNTTQAFPLELQGNNSHLEIVATSSETTVPVNVTVTSIANNNVTLTGEGKANGTITKTAAPSGNLATFLQSSAWEGTFVADWAGATATRFDINSYGNANSTVRVTKLVGGYASDGSVNNFTVIPAVEVSGFMTLDNGYSGKVTTLTKLTGSGVFTNKTYSVDVTTLDNFTGTLATLIGTQYVGMQIGTINLSATPAAGAKIVKITSDSNIGNIGNTKVSVNGVVDDTIALEVKSDGIYVVEPMIDVTVPVVDNTVVTVTVGGETVSPKTEGGNVYAVAPGSVVTVTYTAAEGYRFPDGVQSVYNVTADEDTSVEVSEDLVSELLVAKVRNTASSQDDEYTTLAAAVAATKDGNHNPMVTLKANIDEAEVTVDSAIVLLGNYTISSDIKVVAGGQLQLMQVTLAGKLTIEENGIYVTGGGTLSELVTKDGAKIQLTTLSDTAAPLSVTTLSVAGELTIISSWGLAVRDTYYKALSYVTANADIAEGATVDSVNEWSAKVEEEGDNTVVYLAITKVAVVDGVYYDTAQEAVEAAVASGEPAEFRVQTGTVTLGAGETLVVKGAFLPTVELEDGLTTPPYSLETTPYSEVTGLTIYTVVKEVSVVPASVVISYNTYAELSVIGYDEGATFGWTMYTNGVACSSMSGPVKISSGKTKATLKVYSETTAFDNVVAKVAITNGEEVIEREATITVADVAAKVGETEYTKAELNDAIAAAIASGEVLEHYFGVSTTISKGQTLKTKKLAERNGTASVKAAASTTAGEAWAISKSAEDEDGVITWSVETETPIFVFTSEDGETVEYLAAPKNAAGTNKLLSDATITKQFSVTKVGVVLDLNGHALTSTYSSTTAGAIYVNVISPAPAALTVKDSVGGGSIAAASAHSVFMLGNNGQLTVEGGSFTGKHIVYGSKTTSVATITGGTFTATDAGFTLNMLDSARGTITVTGGTFTGFNPANNAAEGAGTNFVPNGYVSTETSTGSGVWVVTEKQGIDPTDPTSTQEVTPSEQEIVDAGSAEAAAKAKATVTVPEAVATATGVTAETYKSYFTLSATETAPGSGVYEVAIADLNKDVVFPAVEAETLTGDLADVLDVAAGADVAITTAKPGLYYSIEAANSVDFATGKVEGDRKLATGTTVSPAKPDKTGDAVFFRVKVSTTQE